MICRIRGSLVAVGPETVELAVGGLVYEVTVSPATAEHLAEREVGAVVELHVYNFLQIDGNRGLPVLMGFETPAHLRFFERLLDVPRLGPRGALRSMTVPVATYARAIEIGDTRLLRSLPGVGPQKAKDIVASLQGKMGPFVDVAEVESTGRPTVKPESDAENEALAILETLGVGRADALRSILALRDHDPPLRTADEIVKAVFRRS